MHIKFNLSNLKETLIPLIVKQIPVFSIIPLTGPLGVGKTTLTKLLLRHFGITQIVTSPTFGYVNSYKAKQSLTFNHFDLYRIDSIESFCNQGLDEYLHQNDNINLIEWPEVITNLLSQENIKQKVFPIEIRYDNSDAQERVAILPKLTK